MNINSFFEYQNNISNNISEKYQTYLNFTDNKENSNNPTSKLNEENQNEIKCPNCGKNYIKYIDKKNGNLYCSECYNKLNYKIDGIEIDKINKDETDKIYFLNSIENIIKYILLKCSDILTEEEINKNSNIIRKKINYPKIGDDPNDYGEFLFFYLQCK